MTHTARPAQTAWVEKDRESFKERKSFELEKGHICLEVRMGRPTQYYYFAIETQTWPDYLAKGTTPT